MRIEEAQRQVDELIRDNGGYWSELSIFAKLVEESENWGKP